MSKVYVLPDYISFKLTMEDLSVRVCQLLESRKPKSVPIEFVQDIHHGIPSHRIVLGVESAMKLNMEKPYSSTEAVQDFTQEIGKLVFTITDGIEKELTMHIDSCMAEVEKVIVYGLQGRMVHVKHQRLTTANKDCVYFTLRDASLQYSLVEKQ